MSTPVLLGLGYLVAAALTTLRLAEDVADEARNRRERKMGLPVSSRWSLLCVLGLLWPLVVLFLAASLLLRLVIREPHG